MRDSEKTLATALASALEDWSSWPCSLASKPTIIGRDNAGTEAQSSRSNNVYHLSDGRIELALRLHSPLLTTIDRNSERKSQLIAAGLALSPDYIHLSEDHSYSIISWIPARHKYTLEEKELAALLSAIAALHDVKHAASEIQTVDYLRAADSYLAIGSEKINMRPDQHLASDSPSSTGTGTETLLSGATGLAPIRQQIAEYERQFGHQRSFTHNDLNPENILWPNEPDINNSCLFIDWEFSGLGIASFDYAAISVEFSIPPSQLVSIALTQGIELSEIELLSAIDCYRAVTEIYSHALSPGKAG